MNKLRLLLLVAIVAVTSSGCNRAFMRRERGTLPEMKQPPAVELYRLHPQLLLLERTLDNANVSFTLGDLDYSRTLTERLLVHIGDLWSTSPEWFVCAHLDTLERRVHILRERIHRTETAAEWSSHMAAVLDSIGRHHVVEESIGIVMNWRTEHWIRYFTGRGRGHFARWLERVEIYRGIIEPILVAAEMPRDLVFLAVIESGLNLNARSSAKATGPWQFMAGTGRRFGLRQNWWIDERIDIIASTYAAANYMKFLYGLFGSWELALASYNAGEYRVADAISRQKTDDYWRLRLPSQTVWFVPKFMAALEIGRNPSAYGFEIPGGVEPLRFDIISIDRSTDLKHIAAGAGCTVAAIKALNPALKRWATPPGMEIELKVPRGTAEKVLTALAAIPSEQRVSWHRHPVARGETLSRIAARYEISQAELKRINGITNPHRIREGAVLMIPVRDMETASAEICRPRYEETPDLPKQITIRQYAPPAGHTKIVYTVRDRDTLSQIAGRHGVSLAALRRWNNMRFESVIHPGDNLVLYLPGVASSGARNPQEDNSIPPGDGKRRLEHVVQRGETLSSISRRYSTTISAILSWNTGVKRDRLYPGDQLTIWTDAD